VVAKKYRHITHRYTVAHIQIYVHIQIIYTYIRTHEATELHKPICCCSKSKLTIAYAKYTVISQTLLKDSSETYSA